VYRASQPLLLAGVERDCEVNAKETTGRPTQGGSLRSVVLKCAGSVIDGRVAAGAYHSPPRDVGTVIRHCLPDRTGGPRTECGGNPAVGHYTPGWNGLDDGENTGDEVIAEG
jgi:hypothetical protein